MSKIEAVSPKMSDASVFDVCKARALLSSILRNEEKKAFDVDSGKLPTSMAFSYQGNLHDLQLFEVGPKYHATTKWNFDSPLKDVWTFWQKNGDPVVILTGENQELKRGIMLAHYWLQNPNDAVLLWCIAQPWFP